MQFGRHVFVCTNVREPGSAQSCCTNDGKGELQGALKDAARAAGLGSRVRINKSGCLDQCEHGPVVVVYPEGVWYGSVSQGDVAETVAEHLVGGWPVKRLRLAEDCLNTPQCPHRRPPGDACAAREWAR